MLSKLFSQFIKRKFITAVALLLLSIGVGYAYHQFTGNGTDIRYVTAVAEQGTLVSSISGSGQVSVSNQVDIKSKVSGEIVNVYVIQGQEIGIGKLLIQIDSSDASRAVRDAETSLETAKLELDKLLEPIDELTLLQAENSLTQAKESKQKAEDNLKKAYEDGFNTVADAFLDLPTIMTSLQDILFSNTFAQYQSNINFYSNTINNYNNQAYIFEDDARKKYQIARILYNQNFNDYKIASRFSTEQAIEFLIDQTYNTTRDIAEAVKSVSNLVLLYQDELTERNLTPKTLSNTHLSKLNTYTSTTNRNILSLLSIQRSIKDSKGTFISAERSIKEKELFLVKVKQDPDNLDTRAKKIVIQQKEDALLTAKQNLAKHFVRAPFGGVVAKVNTSRGDSISSSTTLITLITKQKIAEVTLNEIDVARVEIGQLATLLFDAVENITLTGKVIEIDTLGTVTQGVVTYNVKIAFDTQDERIKPGMTIDASIITDRKDSIVLVPNAAIQRQGGQIFVDILENGVPRSVPVEVGLSNEISTEIVSGLSKGVQVVTARLEGEGSSQAANIGQSFGGGIPGLGGGGGFRGGGGFGH